jgi:hypothetical protein
MLTDDEMGEEITRICEDLFDKYDDNPSLIVSLLINCLITVGLSYSVKPELIKKTVTEAIDAYLKNDA